MSKTLFHNMIQSTSSLALLIVTEIVVIETTLLHLFQLQCIENTFRSLFWGELSIFSTHSCLAGSRMHSQRSLALFQQLPTQFKNYGRINLDQQLSKALEVLQADQLKSPIFCYLAALMYSSESFKSSSSLISLFYSFFLILSLCSFKAPIAEETTTILPSLLRRGKNCLMKSIVESKLLFIVYSASATEGFSYPKSTPNPVFATIQSNLMLSFLNLYTSSLILLESLSSN